MRVKPIVYVAGPYRSVGGEWGTTENIRAAETFALGLWRRGAVAICPHKNTAYFGGAAPDEVWLEGDLELVKVSDALLLVPGWMESIGTRVEFKLAVSIGLTVFDFAQDIKDTWMLVEKWVWRWRRDHGLEQEDDALCGSV